jgi:short-subunit dehydrogenase
MTNPNVILITGASSGIGAATARLFAREGYRVALAARRIDRLEEITSEIQAHGGQALALAVDVTGLPAVNQMVETVIKEWGQIDVLLNNAGLGRMGWLEALIPEEDILPQLATNLTGAILVSRAVLPHMITRRKGHILNMGSIAALVASPTYSIYAASKFGLRGFSEALRREVGIYGIHVSMVYPGAVHSEFADHAKIQRKTGTTTPKALVLEAEDVAKGILTLVKKPRREMVLPGIMRVTIWLNILFPGLVDRVIEKRFTIPERFG